MVNPLPCQQQITNSLTYNFNGLMMPLEQLFWESLVLSDGSYQKLLFIKVFKKFFAINSSNYMAWNAIKD